VTRRADTGRQRLDSRQQFGGIAPGSAHDPGHSDSLFRLFGRLARGVDLTLRRRPGAPFPSLVRPRSGPAMAWPVRHLPVLQNWDCHACGECCREYQVTVTEAERQRIESQGWHDDPGYAGLPLFIKGGTWRQPVYRLNARADNTCIFLG